MEIKGEMEVKTNLFAAAVLLFCLMCSNLTGVEVGEKAPPLKVAKWIKNEPVDYLKRKDEGIEKDIVVLCFWATWSETTDNLIRFMNTEKEVYQKENVVFIALSNERTRLIERYVKSNKNISFAVGADKKSETYDEYMIGTSGVPMFFIIDKSRDLLWKGSPFAVDRILSRVVTGTYDEEKENKIEKIREKLQRSIQYLNFNRQNELAEEILKIDPIDQMAINNIVDNYIRKDEIDKAIKFIMERIKLANYNQFVARSMYFNLLTIIQGLDNEKGKKYLKECIDGYFEAFKNNPEALNSFSVAIVQGMPMSIVPLNKIYKMVSHVIKLQKNINPKANKELGIYYRSMAKIFYLTGMLDRAVEVQKKSLEYLKKTKDNEYVKQAELLLKYYKSAIEIKKKLSV
ncbi:MAG: redoxin domain-containing protein [Victivallales bacterium]|nr:redoxin domain-containing protein [Victivallales bacterium]